MAVAVAVAGAGAGRTGSGFRGCVRGLVGGGDASQIGASPNVACIDKNTSIHPCSA